LLALGVGQEVGGHENVAADAYQVVASTDPSYVSASFGLARILRRSSDRRRALEALSRVPGSSSSYQAARVASFHTLIETTATSAPSRDDLVAASEITLGITGDPLLRAETRRDLMVAALDLLQRDGPAADTRIGGVALEEVPVRQAIEQSCRTLSRLAPTESERIGLVDEANRYRPRSLV